MRINANGIEWLGWQDRIARLCAIVGCSEGLARCVQIFLQRLGGAGMSQIYPRGPHEIIPSRGLIWSTPWCNELNSGQACRPYRGSCSPIPGRVVLVTSPGTESSYPRPLQSLKLQKKILHEQTWTVLMYQCWRYINIKIVGGWVHVWSALPAEYGSTGYGCQPCSGSAQTEKMFFFPVPVRAWKFGLQKDKERSLATCTQHLYNARTFFLSGWCFSTLWPRAGFLTLAYYYVRIQSINQ